MLEFVKNYPLIVAAILVSGFGGTQWLIVYYVRGVRQDFKTVFGMLESHRDMIADNSKKMGEIAGAHRTLMEVHKCPIERATEVLDNCPLFGESKQ